MSNTIQEPEVEESASVVKAEISADEFALGETFTAVPDVTFRSEQLVETGGRIVMPLLWAYGADRELLEEALADDPSVNTASLVTAFDDKLLYRVEWDDTVRFVFDVITNSHAVILDLHGDAGTWTLRLLYPDRELLSNTHRFCDDHQMRLNIRSICEMDDEHVGQFGLTSKQYEALTTAYERGYYQVPCGTDLNELAEELDVSHQALSERLRRATMILVGEALLAGPPSADTEI